MFRFSAFPFRVCAAGSNDIESDEERERDKEKEQKWDKKERSESQ